MTKKSDEVANAIRATFVSPNESDRNGEPANLVDGVFAVARAIHDLADAVRQARGQRDEQGVGPSRSRIRE